MLELRSGSATNHVDTNTEIIIGTNIPSSTISTPPIGASNAEKVPSGVAPPITRTRAADIPSCNTPPVTRSRSAAATPNMSSNTTPPTRTTTTTTPPSRTETGGTRNRPYVTVAKLMEKKEVMDRAQTYMVTTQ
ncbi:uncharacterized protein PB18E9.04c-like [Papaver somniferum]|uniref:uncharacterized protein PB18E9.04c-like n=1 Tax=Papaver somniferum TaxID=3469 RepID=UPI000E6F5995|nr:uncharacterized protein PB18E9.04c-like [Papaver somniferum]